MGNDLAKIKKEKNRVFFGTNGEGRLLCCFLQPFFGKHQLSAGGLGPFLKFSSQFLPGFGLRATFGSLAVRVFIVKTRCKTVGARLPTNLSIGKFVVEMMTG